MYDTCDINNTCITMYDTCDTDSLITLSFGKSLSLYHDHLVNSRSFPYVAVNYFPKITISLF